MARQRKREVVVKHQSNIKLSENDTIQIIDLPIVCKLTDFYSDDHSKIELVRLDKINTKHLEGMFTRPFLKEFKANIFNGIRDAFLSDEYLEMVNKEYDKHKQTVIAVKDAYGKVLEEVKNNKENSDNDVEEK